MGFEGARLQPCHSTPKSTGALAPARRLFSYFFISRTACTQAFITSSSVTPCSILQFVNASSFWSHCATRSPFSLYRARPLGGFGISTRDGLVTGGAVTLAV